MLWLPLDLRPLRYDYFDVSGSNWFDLSQPFWTELVRRCMHKGLELFSYLNLKDRTLFSNPLPSSTLPAFPFEGAKKMPPPAANSLSSEFY